MKWVEKKIKRKEKKDDIKENRKKTGDEIIRSSKKFRQSKRTMTFLLFAELMHVTRERYTDSHDEDVEKSLFIKSIYLT
jgi:uncharacterized secreted protein with C-terminal beta-propeller domain